jgi:hypothetical protein
MWPIEERAMVVAPAPGEGVGGGQLAVSHELAVA